MGKLREVEFHHVLTEVPCLCIRVAQSQNDQKDHGIIPFLLNGTDKCFLEFLRSLNIRIEPRRGKYRNQHLHKGFFRLLKKLLSTHNQKLVDCLTDYYDECVRRIQDDTVPLMEEMFLQFVAKEYHSKVQTKLKVDNDATLRTQQSCITLTDKLESRVPLDILRASLREYASIYCCSIQRVSGKSLSMEQCYINLAVVEHVRMKAKAEGKDSKEFEQEHEAKGSLEKSSKPFHQLPKFEATGTNLQVLVLL
jgi:hypothetical protein